ncbi:glycosyltransferase family 8 protein [Paracoccus sulfuroxidans]|uniref:Lipopolysaccharide biosynthesis glycosyltransferase n=1 Tax=Paracoccus sulfuroxidans TaxID=384678 RepID=A0A562NSA3_9RHOB|nr:glycosyltransferase family 8 protein [Paracoccus sulfuroxidans]TWI35074.1 lipopolysaccharide biosynthesis glycosyltransferase [Paracoccus sulfuroxidans]
MTDAQLHIVTGSDDNYVPGVMVLIASAHWHNPGARFTVLDLGISAENRARIDRLAARLDCRIDRIEISDSIFAAIPVRRAHLTRSTYLRLLIPELMPEAERVVYMDCDMVVTGDLTPLATMDLGAAPVAAVACPGPDKRELAATGTQRGEYVNAGLLVMNLPVLRRDGFAARCLELLSDPAHPLLSEDQSALNIAYRGQMLYLPGRFNVYANEATYPSAEDLPDQISVLHYVVSMKPWLWSVPFGEVWQFHANRIADLMPPRKRSFRHYRTRAEMYRRNAFGLALGKKKHWRRIALRRAIRQGFVADYLRAQAARAN